MAKAAPTKPAKTAAARPRKAAVKRKPLRPDADGVVRLSGGNPQIAKGYGDEPVQAWIAAAPGWKSDVARRLDAIITRAVPGVRKAVKWNSPLYGVEEGSWFLGVHCMTKYVKIAFFRGAELEPVPPVDSKQKNVRYFHVHEDDRLDEKQFVAWVKQASKLPGEKM